MNHKVIIRLTLLVVLAMTLFLGSAILLLLQQNQHASSNATVASEIVLRVFENKTLTDEYAQLRSSRARTQLQLRQDSLIDFLRQNYGLFQVDEQLQLYEQIAQNTIEGKDIFTNLVTLYEEEYGLISDELFIQKSARINSQLSVKFQQTIAAAADLKDLNDAQVHETSNMMLALFIGGGGIFLILLIGSFAVIWFSVTSLSRRKQEIESILNGIGDGVIAVDKQWNIILFNHMAAQITGWSQEEAIGKHLRTIFKLISEKDRQPSVEFISKAMELGTIQSMSNNTLLITKDGKEIQVADSASPIIGENNHVEGVIIIFRDVTEEKEAAMLKSDFTFASNQFRAPTARALSSVEALSTKQLDPQSKEELERIKLAIKNIDSLSEQLLDITKVDQKKVLAKMEPVVVEGVITSVSRSVQGKSRQKNISVTIDSHGTPQSIFTDPELLHEALTKLVENAIEYGRQGGQVLIDTEFGNESLVIKVIDNGIGIPGEQKSNIFTKFFRGQNIPEDSVGAGLGLYLAREYIKLIGGKIWFESEEGKGTVFFVELPVGL